MLVSGSARIGPYLESGRVDSALIRELVERHGKPMAELEDVLDFGCGCARIARWWADLEGSTIHGCDANPKLAAWTQRNIPFLTAATNGLEPPLPDGDASFDLVYAVSILTHLPRELQACWLDELVRVLRPGGLLLFSVAGERLAGSLGAGERAAFDRGELVVQFEEVAGTNLCAAYHPHAYVRERMLGNLELLESVHEDPSGTGVASPLTRQDIYLARKADA